MIDVKKKNNFCWFVFFKGKTIVFVQHISYTKAIQSALHSALVHKQEIQHKPLKQKL